MTRIIGNLLAVFVATYGSDGYRAVPPLGLRGLDYHLVGAVFNIFAVASAGP